MVDSYPNGPNGPALIGGLEHVLFFHMFGIIIPTGKLILFRGVCQPPTSTGCKKNIQYPMAL